MKEESVSETARLGSRQTMLQKPHLTGIDVQDDMDLVVLEYPGNVGILVVAVDELLDETPQQLRRRHLPRVDAASQQHPPLSRIASSAGRRHDEGVDVVSAFGDVELSVGPAVVSREVRGADSFPSDEAGVLLDQVVHRLHHAFHRADARAALDRVVGETPDGHRAERKQEDRLPCHHLIGNLWSRRAAPSQILEQGVPTSLPNARRQALV